MKIEYNLFGADKYKMRVIYYAEPIDPNQIPSDKPDQDRLEAKYVSLEEYKLMQNIKGNKLI